MSVQNPQLAGFLLTGNRSIFLYVEGSTAWLYDFPHFLSPLYNADRCFDRIPIHYKDTLMYVDPITRQTYNYATPIPCDNNPRNIIELDLILMTKIFIFFAQNLQKENLLLCLHLIKSKLNYTQIHLQLKTLVFIQMQN